MNWRMGWPSFFFGFLAHWIDLDANIWINGDKWSIYSIDLCMGLFRLPSIFLLFHLFFFVSPIESLSPPWLYQFNSIYNEAFGTCFYMFRDQKRFHSLRHALTMFFSFMGIDCTLFTFIFPFFLLLLLLLFIDCHWQHYNELDRCTITNGWLWFQLSSPLIHCVYACFRCMFCRQNDHSSHSPKVYLSIDPFFFFFFFFIVDDRRCHVTNV